MPSDHAAPQPSALPPQSLRELEGLVETAHIGLALVRDRHIVLVNAHGAAILGRPAPALLGMDIGHFLPDTAAYDQLLAAARRQDPPQTCTTACVLTPLDGDPIRVQLHVRRVDADRRGETVAWSFADQAEHAAIQEALHASQHAAAAANEAKTHFLANISHELRTPLNGILGMAQLLLDGNEVRDEAREFLGIIRQSAGVLVHILGDLLDMSKVESGKLLMEEREFDLRAECAPLLRNFTVQSQLRPFSFTAAIDPDIPTPLYGDPTRTKQILINLLGNAFKYTRQGQVSLRIALDTDAAAAPPPDRVRLRITVADTGIGIAPDRQDAIFEPFGIGEDYLTKKYSGVGLGLSIAKRLATMMHGDITLESTPGKGSTFFLTLEFGLLGSAVTTAAPPLPPPCPTDRPLHILLAEDEPVNRIFTTRALEKLGHTVETAVDGQEALTMLGRAAYDLVLMDIQMPYLNGLEATRRIRSGQEPGIAPDIPVVALSAYAMASDRARGLDAGMDAYVTKPYDVTDLLAAMHRVLTRGNAQRAQAAGGGV